MRTRSIHARLMAWGAGLTAAALLAAWAGISTLLQGFVEHRLDAELAAAARAVMAGSEWSDLEASGLTVQPGPSDPRFEAPYSGWYWQVTDGTAVLARSSSLLGAELSAPGRQGPDGEVLRAHEETYTAPGDARPLRVTVTLPNDEVQAELSAIRMPLMVSLWVLGSAILAALLLAVRVGLRDLREFAAGLAALREGRSSVLPSTQVAELCPLAVELQRLLDVNAEQAARAKAQAADLAHALKTPLAVLANRASAEDAALIARMDAMIRWHLRRAQATNAGLNPAARTALGPVLEDLALVLRAQAARHTKTLTIEADDALIFRGESEDLAEILSALAENALHWARAHVRITAHERHSRLLIEVADDGPGIPPEQREHILGRGARLDQSGTGHGLGLAIAADRIRAYAGMLTLETAPEGGLLARVELPAAPSQTRRPTGRSFSEPTTPDRHA